MHYLFERLYDPARQSSGDPASDPALDPTVRDAVRDQVQRLAWSSRIREGDAEANVVPLGMPSTAEIGATLRMEQYAQAFQRLLERHEPRLSDVNVTVERIEALLDPYRLTVSGVLDASGAPEALSFTIGMPGA